MLRKYRRIRIGLRTIKTAVAAMISMVIVYFYGTTASKLVFAMLGAMDAVQLTFKASCRACLTQIAGVLFGAVMGMGLMVFPVHSLALGL